MPRVLKTPFILSPEGGDELGELEEGKRLLGFPNAHVEVPFHPKWLSGKESACQCRRCGFDPWVRKITWRGYGNSLQYSAWKISWREEPGGLQSMRL